MFLSLRGLIQNLVFRKNFSCSWWHFFGSVSRPETRCHFCIFVAFHRSLFVPSCYSSSRLKVGQGGGTVTNHYVDIGRKKRKERPLGRERWWLIFVQTRLQTVWRERFRTIFKVASRKKRSPPKNHESHARLSRNVIQFWCESLFAKKQKDFFFIFSYFRKCLKY